MEHHFNTKVYYSDTDAYGVVWHGAYLRWLEKGRIDFCEQFGFNLIELQNENIVLPVASIEIKYKYPAKLNDNLIVSSEIETITPLYLTFCQKIYDENMEKLFIEAKVKVVATDNNGKLYRRMPTKLYEAFKNETK
ncbi:acyl-CoA thioesterase [bacterium]|nr:acyl-CoA thioesterase [bacterium]